LLVAPAAAQVSNADHVAARALAQQGQEALDAKDWASAAERFHRADALVHAPTLMLGLARAEVGGGRWIAALEHYNRIVRETIAPGSPAVFAKAQQDARKELAALEPRVPAVIIQVTGPGAAGARVTLDGAPIPAAALGINWPADPGTHTLRGETDRYAPVDVTVTLAERKVETATLRIEKLEAPSPVAGPTPSPSPRGSPLQAIGFAGIGVGGAALIMGVVTGCLALSKAQNLSRICPGGHCDDQQTAIDSYYLAGNLSTAGFVAGGLLAATGVVLVIVAPKGPARADAWMAPVITPGYAGLHGGF
jgi:hypothetical protein